MALIGKVELAFEAKAILGEGPVWDAQRQCLWFVDIKAPAIWRFDPSTGDNASYPAPDQVGWVLPTSCGQLLAGLRDGLHLFDPESGTFDKRHNIHGMPEGNRLNDACVDRFGRVWFGSMDDAEEQASGRFYCFDRGELNPAGPDAITITNGPAADADGTVMYFTDTLGQAIYRSHIDSDGALREWQPLIDIAADFPDAYPDGPIVDSEGCLWTGLWNGFAVARYSPEGQLLGQVAIPAANVTKMAFGGPDLKTAYVTTASKGLADHERTAQPLAGAVFTFRSDVSGIPIAPVEIK
ncbi:SMP-30/gluconolactonase/LRE family protein [Altererythrobacter indicus]|uniref:SMP-30/gluconolactonase/LRE family protein n=1 Tax=Altericroceibacterium indicum TaxID=374177 RepID=A0A845A795_9SPHN|nr:SMP-30/gluconolactonase/LRE family protein [Altericroceibacterium indicum]